MVFVFVFSFVLTSVFLLSYHHFAHHRHPTKMLSFSAGMLVFIIFLDILPKIFVFGTSFHSSEYLSSLLLLGFLFYHILDIYLHRKIRQRKELIYRELHSFGFFVDNFIKGFMLVIFFSLFDNLLIAFIPIVLVAAAAGMSFAQCTKSKFSSLFVVFTSLFYLFGTVFALILEESTIHAALPFISGAFMYFVLRDEFPKEQSEEVLYFILGIAFMFSYNILT